MTRPCPLLNFFSPDFVMDWQWCVYTTMVCVDVDFYLQKYKMVFKNQRIIYVG